MTLSSVINQMQENITEIFDTENLDALAREHRFIMRSTNRINAIDFVQLMTVEVLKNPQVSLDGLADLLSQLSQNTEISRQALQQRINTAGAVSFLRDIFCQSLSEAVTPVFEITPPQLLASFGRVFPLLWLGFFLGAFAGVMSIGHATGIVASHGGGAELALLGTIVINIGNAGGRIVSGWLADHIAPPRVAAASHLSAAAGFALILTAPGPTTAVAALGLQGLAYGLASGGYLAAIGIYFGLARYGRYLGFLITAWGLAGLSGPWLAGRLYDLSGGYEASETIGLVVVLAALALTFAIPRPNPSRARASS